MTSNLKPKLIMIAIDDAPCPIEYFTPRDEGRIKRVARKTMGSAVNHDKLRNVEDITHINT